MSVSSVERPVSALRQRMLKDMDAWSAFRDAARLRSLRSYGGKLVVPLPDKTPGEHMYHLVYPTRSSGMAAFEEFKKWIVLEASKEN
jgi:hypothetical protein